MKRKISSEREQLIWQQQEELRRKLQEGFTGYVGRCPYCNHKEIFSFTDTDGMESHLFVAGHCRACGHFYITAAYRTPPGTEINLLRLQKFPWQADNCI